MHALMSTTSFFLTAALLLSSGCAHHRVHPCPHHKQGRSERHGGGPGHEHTIQVVGTGEVTATPDVAHTRVGVQARAADSASATQQINQQMTAVIKALKKAGVAEADLQTDNVSISFHPDPAPPQPLERPEEARKKAGATAKTPAKDEPTGHYVAHNMVRVTIRDLDRASAVLDAATRAGANQVWGLSFEVSDMTAVEARARAQAVQAARAQAEQLAQLTSVELGPVVSIQDGGASHGRPIMQTMAARDEAAASMPVERGELTIRHQVTVLYGIKPKRD